MTKNATNVRAMTSVFLPIDGCRRLQPPSGAWSTPTARFVRVRLASGASDWSLEALTAVAGICINGADVMVESDNASLAADFSAALARRLRELHQVDDVA